MKAAEIPDAIVFQAIDAKAPRWACISDVAALVPHMPWKVVLAKCAQMIRKGRIDGCPCGCRGDLQRVEVKKAASRFTPKPTTTLSAAGPEATTVISCFPDRIDPDTPMLLITEEITVAELTRRYPGIHV